MSGRSNQYRDIEVLRVAVALEYATAEHCMMARKARIFGEEAILAADGPRQRPRSSAARSGL